MKEFPKRGEIYLVCLDPAIGSEINKSRPALIISNDINNEKAPTITVIPITSNIEKIYPFEVIIASIESGLSKKSKAKCNQIRTIDKRRLHNFIGEITTEELKNIEKALLIHLGIPYRLGQ
jgi:mRNA interferase MazF